MWADAPGQRTYRTYAPTEPSNVRLDLRCLPAPLTARLPAYTSASIALTGYRPLRNRPSALYTRAPRIALESGP